VACGGGNASSRACIQLGPGWAEGRLGRGERVGIS